MLNAREIGRLPESIRLVRNGHELVALRKAIGTIRIANRSIWIGNPELVEQLRPLPVHPSNGDAEVYSYEWKHPRGPFDICAVISFRPQRAALPRRLRIDNRPYRPDLKDGMVDTAEIIIRSDTSLTMPTGFGDGYYPVTANYNFGLALQSLVVDFEVWRVREVIYLTEKQFDQYRIPID
jgi:hypothetical protein